VTDHAATERFQALYAEHHARVYAYAVSRVGRQLADEVVSEVFLVAWRRLADVPTPALPWLLAVARGRRRVPAFPVISAGTVRRRTLDRQRGRPAPPARAGPGNAWRAASAGRCRMRRSAWSCVLSLAWC
jgi:hypothetical protein